MGACISSASATAAVDYESKHQNLPTARIIVPDGCLLEFPAETTVRAVLADPGDHLLNTFLCSSDELYFNAKIPALAADDTLRLGQLYFLLPLSKLHHPLSGADMAELAVRASVALSTYASDDGERRGKSGRRLMPVAAELAGGHAVLNEVVNEKEIGFYSEFYSSDRDYASKSSFEKKKTMKRSESVPIKSRQRRRSRGQRLSMIEEIEEWANIIV